MSQKDYLPSKTSRVIANVKNKKKRKEIVTEKERMHRFNWKLNEMSYQFSALKR